MFNVERTPCAPPSLLKQKKYDDNDVWQALENIFYKKCYLCETVEPLDLNVEHLKSHKGDKALKFSWGNLYFACARCNNIKSTRYDDILDCCNPGENVFESIKCLPPHSPRSSRLVVEALSQNDRVIKTCELLNEIYNNDSSVNKKISAAYLRSKVWERFALLSKYMVSYFAVDATDSEKQIALEKIGILLRRDQAYSAFSRWVVLCDEELSNLLGHLLD